MQPPDRTSAEIFADYHGRGSKRWVIVAGIVAVCLAVGGSAATVAVITGTGSRADDPAARSLNAADFSTTIKESQERARSVHFDLTITAGGSTTTAYGDVATGATSADTLMTMTTSIPEAGEATAMFVDGTAYVSMGESTHNRFIEIDPEDTADPLAASFTGLATAADPGQTVTLPKDAIASVKVAGPAVELDGVEAVPYAVVVNTAAAATALGYPAEVVATLPPQLEYRYWIGPDRLLRKVAYEQSGARFEIAFTRWGQTVPIEAPTADQITTRTIAT